MYETAVSAILRGGKSPVLDGITPKTVKATTKMIPEEFLRCTTY